MYREKRNERLWEKEEPSKYVTLTERRASLLGSINMKFLHFAREVLYWMFVLKSMHLELLNWWPKADGLKTAFPSGKLGSAHTVSLPLENQGETTPVSTHRRAISPFLFLCLPLTFNYVHLLMFIFLYCYLGQTNCISSQTSYFGAIHCFPEM